MSGPIVLVLRVLLALALYVFLGWTLWTIWQDLRRAGIKASGQKIPPVRLEVRLTKQIPAYRAFSQAEVMLGRDPACDVIIDDAAVSARHARLSYHHGQWWLEDLESTNGTKLNNARLTTATVLTGGDVIKCGKARVIVNLRSEEFSTEIAAENNGRGGL